MAALLSGWLKNLHTDKELENKVLQRTLCPIQNNKWVPKPSVSSIRSFLASETQDPENTFIGFPNSVFFPLRFSYFPTAVIRHHDQGSLHKEQFIVG